MVITVIDITMYEEYMDFFSEFYKNQITYANTIVLSKTQNVDHDKIQKVILQIRRINDKANIITTPCDKLSGENIVAVGEKDKDLDLFKKVNIIKKPSSQIKFNKIMEKNSATDVFIAWGIETPKIFFIEKLESIFDEIKNEQLYGKIIRAKGIIQVDEERGLNLIMSLMNFK